MRKTLPACPDAQVEALKMEIEEDLKTFEAQADALEFLEMKNFANDVESGDNERLKVPKKGMKKMIYPIVVGFLVLAIVSCLIPIIVTYATTKTTNIGSVTLKNKNSYLCGGFHASVIISQGERSCTTGIIGLVYKDQMLEWSLSEQNLGQCENFVVNNYGEKIEAQLESKLADQFCPVTLTLNLQNGRKYIIQEWGTFPEHYTLVSYKKTMIDVTHP